MLRCETSGMLHACFKARCNMQVLNCLDGHPLLHTIAHHSCVLMARVISFNFSTNCSFHSSPTERSWLGFLSCLSSLFFFMGCNWSKTLSRSSYCPKMNWDRVSLHEHSSSFPPEPDVFYCLGNGFTSLRSVVHIDTCIICSIIPFLCS